MRSHLCMCSGRMYKVFKLVRCLHVVHACTTSGQAKSVRYLSLCMAPLLSSVIANLRERWEAMQAAQGGPTPRLRFSCDNARRPSLPPSSTRRDMTSPNLIARRPSVKFASSSHMVRPKGASQLKELHSDSFILGAKNG